MVHGTNRRSAFQLYENHGGFDIYNNIKRSFKCELDWRSSFNRTVEGSFVKNDAILKLLRV